MELTEKCKEEEIMSVSSTNSSVVVVLIVFQRRAISPQTALRVHELREKELRRMCSQFLREVTPSGTRCGVDLETFQRIGGWIWVSERVRTRVVLAERRYT